MKWVIQKDLKSGQTLFLDIERDSIWWRGTVTEALGFYDRRSAEAFWRLLVSDGMVTEDPQVSAGAYNRWNRASSAETTEDVTQ